MKAQRNVMVTVVAGAALAVAAVFAPAAHAEGVSVKEYRSAMRGLINDVAGWNQELDVQLTAMQTKPELACGADYHELVQRGGWIAADLAGTAKNAPQGLIALGVASAQGLKVAVSGADEAATDCDGGHLGSALDKITAGRAQYDDNIARVRVFAIGKGH